VRERLGVADWLRLRLCVRVPVFERVRVSVGVHGSDPDPLDDGVAEEDAEDDALDDEVQLAVAVPVTVSVGDRLWEEDGVRAAVRVTERCVETESASASWTPRGYGYASAIVSGSA